MPLPSSPGNEYTFTDEHPLQGINYYRVAANNIRQETKYSSIVKVLNVITNPACALTAFPNPATGNTLNFDAGFIVPGWYRLEIFNSEGQLMIRKDLYCNGSTISISNKLAAGSYQAILSGNGNSLKTTFIKN